MSAAGAANTVDPLWQGSGLLLSSVVAVVAVTGAIKSLWSMRSLKAEESKLKITLAEVRTEERRAYQETLALAQEAAEPSVTAEEGGVPVGSGASADRLNLGSASGARATADDADNASTAAGFTLEALWFATQTRMDAYHTIATDQAKRSFAGTQLAMVVGFVIVIGLGVQAARAETLAASVTTGAVGVIGGGLSAYIGKTFMRAQTDASDQLKRFFLQPVENTRLLGAERLIEQLPPEARTAAIMKVIEGMTFSIDHNSSTSKSL